MKKVFALFLVFLSTSAFLSEGAMAQQPLKIGLILPMTGPFASTGKQVVAAVKLYMAEHGDVVAGRKIELLTPGRHQCPGDHQAFRPGTGHQRSCRNPGRISV